MVQIAATAIAYSTLGVICVAGVIGVIDAHGLERAKPPKPATSQTQGSIPRIQIARPQSGARPIICKNQLLPGSYMRERVCKSKPAWQSQPEIVPGPSANPDDDPVE